MQSINQRLFIVPQTEPQSLQALYLETEILPCHPQLNNFPLKIVQYKRRERSAVSLVAFDTAFDLYFLQYSA